MWLVKGLVLTFYFFLSCAKSDICLLLLFLSFLLLLIGWPFGLMVIVIIDVMKLSLLFWLGEREIASFYFLGRL